MNDYYRKLFHPILNKKINIIFSKTVEELVNKELLLSIPVASLNPKLCLNTDRKKAEDIICKKIAETNQEVLYETAPYLKKVYQTVVNNHRAMMETVISRIELHKNQISSSLLNVSDFGEILSISGDGADVHNHGQLTLIIETEQGKFLYKPHSCGIDAIIYNLTVQYFSDIIRIPKSLDFGDYGFCEFIENNLAKDKEEAEKFYFRFGGLAAFATVLGATDLHYDNILTNDGYPIPVDLETMMMPSVSGYLDNSYQLRYVDDYNYSIMTSCLLPRVLKKEEFSPLMNQSEKNRSAPVIDGIRQTVLNYEDAFLKGFDLVYDRCLDLKNELLTAIKKAESAQIRFIVRNTNFYSSLLSALSNPKNAQDLSGQEKILNRLNNAFSDEDKSEYIPIADEEMKSLQERDIPYFYAIGNSHHLFSDGKVVVSDFFKKSAVENAKIRINRLSECEKEFEKQLIKSSFSCALIGENQILTIPDCTKAQPMSEEEALDVAEALWNRIWDSSIVFPCGARSFCGNYNALGNFSCIGLDFAHGLEGILVFASALNSFGRGKQKQTEELSRIMKEYIEKVILFFEREEVIPENMKNKGLTSGFAGTIKMLELIGKFTPSLFKEDYLKQIIGILDRTGIETEENPDVYEGLSGLILALCSLSKDYEIVNYVKKAADRLLELKTMPDKGQILWKTVSKERIISGYGHGVAGIGMALLKAFELTKEERYRKAAEDAFYFEHRIYSERIANWPDLRRTSVPDSTLNGICTGAPGVGIAMQIAEKFAIPFAKEDYLLAIEAVRKNGLKSRDTLCCGNSSAVELLISAGYREEALLLLGKMQKKADLMGDYTYLPKNYRNRFVPTMFFGAAGLGYTLLRAADSKHIPSIFI